MCWRPKSTFRHRDGRLSAGESTVCDNSLTIMLRNVGRIGAWVFFIDTLDGLNAGAVSSATAAVPKARTAITPSALKSFESKDLYLRMAFTYWFVTKWPSVEACIIMHRK